MISKIEPDKRWYSVEMTKERAELFKVYLGEHSVTFEPSEAFNLIHFECLMTQDELTSANEWISANLY